MSSTLAALFALFGGTTLFVVGVGLLGTTLALRAEALGFSGSLIGAIMAAYFAGFVVGTFGCPKVVIRVGHVRAFSAFAATTATAVLLHALWPTAVAWMLLRLITGACVVGLYMVIESWINERAGNDHRGRVFAFYQFVSLAALALGQYLILLGRRDPAIPLIVAGALFSIGIVPVVMTRVPPPAPIFSARLDLRGLWRISPLGVAGTFAAATANGALFALGPVFARRIGLAEPGIALFMSLTLLGGAVLQWPIGRLSDRFDRRTITLTVSLLGAGIATAAWYLVASHAWLLVAVFFYGGAAFSLYPLCAAHANDRQKPGRYVATASGLLLVYGVGAVLGPLIVGPLMERFGPRTFLLFLVLTLLVLTLFIFARMGSRSAPPHDAQEPFVMLARTSPAALEMLEPDPGAARGGVGLESEEGPMPAADSPSGSRRRPRTGMHVLALVLVVAIGVSAVIWSMLQTRAQSRDLEELMQASGAAVAEALGHAVEDSLRSGTEIEELAAARLLDQARLLDRLDAADPLDAPQLAELATTLTLAAVALVDGSGKVLAAGSGDRSPAGAAAIAADFLPALEPLFAGRADFVVPARHPGPDGRAALLALAVRRSRGGALLVAMEADEMLALQRRIGIEHLLGAVAETGGILFATLESPSGEILAGRPAPLDEPDALRFARDVELDAENRGTLRLGLSRAALADAQRQGRRRTWMLGLALAGLTAALSTALLARQRNRWVRDAEERARATVHAVLESMSDAVLLLDAERTVRLVNPPAARLFGQPAERLVGRPCDAVLCGKPGGTLCCTDAVSEVELDVGSGRRVPLLSSVSTIQAPTTGTVGTAVLLRDLRPLRELEDRARRAENLSALGRMAVAVAHEIRNPLNAIAVAAQRLEREFPPAKPAADHRRLTRLLRDEVARLDGIVDRFLDFARTPRLAPRDGDLDGLLRDMLPMLERGAPPGVRVTARLEASTPGRFDPTALRQVVLNLVRNAFEALPRGGSVRLHTLAAPGSVALEVIDDGPGIPREDLAKLFELGFTTKAGGTGLGLAIVDRLVREMGGEVSVDSPPEGGATVRVRLPAAVRDPAAGVPS